MNYAGKFDAALPLVGQGLPSHAGGHVDSFSATGHGNVPAGAFIVPDANLLFHGEFKRAGADLVVSHDGHEFVLHDYFKGEKRAAVASPDGAHLTGDIVNALAGHVEYAQAAPGAGAAQVIGHVTKLTGSATVIRNGVSIILNNGENVEKGDVVATGSDSTLGITFIDGTVFGLSSNARMVLNDMVYDPNGSNNSSLLSLVTGTITFVAGETAKHGDMKVDTPVATMGIRGTAVVTEISFFIPQATPGNPQPEPQPQANFQVLVEPDGHTGSYILFDKTTLLPIATVNQAGQVVQISGGNVSISAANVSQELQKLISDVFSLKFTDNSNSNTKLTSNFTDSITQDANSILIKLTNGATAQLTLVNPLNTLNGNQEQAAIDKGPVGGRIPGAPDVRSLDLKSAPTTAFFLTELKDTTGGGADPDVIVGKVTFTDFNPGDRPTVQVNLSNGLNYTYKNASQQDVTASLSDLQKQDIKATEISMVVVAAPDNANNGSATWTYSISDTAFDFLAEGETLTLSYYIRVDNNFAPANEFTTIPITITVTGTNDKPVITSSVADITFLGGTSVAGGPLVSSVPTSGTLTFTDVDLTDTHTVSVELTGESMAVPAGPEAIFENAMSVSLARDSTQVADSTGIINWSLADLPAYVADFIPKGEVLTLTYTVTLTDSQGATTTQTITVTIEGTDEPAVVWIATGQPQGGLWKNGANWETGTVPTINDDVIVITDQLRGLTPSFPVTITEAAFAKSLTMNDFDKSGQDTPELVNKSTLTIAGLLTLSADSRLTNFAGAQISVGGEIVVEPADAEHPNTSTITNAGRLILAAGGRIETQTAIVNSGTIDLTGGTLTLQSDVANAGGTVEVDPGAKLIVDAAGIDGGTFVIAGALELDDTVALKGGVTIEGKPGAAKGAMSNKGVLEISGAATLLNDVVTNDGTVNIDGGQTLTLAGTEISGGMVTISGTLESTGISAVNTDITNDGTIEAASGTLTIDAVPGYTVTNHGVITANGGEIDVLDDPIINTSLLEAVAGGTLKLSGLTVTNTGGSVLVDGDSKLYLSGASITGGTLGNAGHFYSVTGSNTVTAAVTNTGTIEVQAGTLDLAAGLTGVGTLIIDDTGTLELAGADAQTVSFAGGTGTLRLDDVAGQSFTGTITATASTGGTFTITGAANLTSGSGDALDFIASGGAAGAPADIVLTPTGRLTGAAGGIVVAQNGVGDISLTATGDITGLAGDGVSLGDGATGVGDIIVTDLTGRATGTGAGSAGVRAANLNAANGGAISITQLGGASGGDLGIDAVTWGGGDLGIAAAGDITGGALYGIRALSYGAGSETVTTDAGSVINSGGSGIVALNLGTSVPDAAQSTINVSARGSIHSGTANNIDGSTPGGIIAGYDPGGAAGFSNNVRGDVTVDSDAAITAEAGYGIEAFTWGIGDVTVTTGGDSSITAAGTAIGAFDHGGGDVTVTNHGSATGAIGLAAFANGAGRITITNDGNITGSSGAGISVTQSLFATGLVHITNGADGHIVGAGSSAAIAIAGSGYASVLIDNSGTIGPDDAGAVSSSTFAITEYFGPITINNSGEINGNLALGTATFNNELGGTWTVAGSSVLGYLSSIVNEGVIDLLDGASIFGYRLGITNDNEIDSWGTTSITGTIRNNDLIEVKSGTLTLFGALGGSGSVTIDHDATLTVENSVSQTITFSGANAELRIGTWSFGGSIAGLAVSDKLDLSNIAYGLGTHATYVSNSQHTGGVLTVTDAEGHSISLTLVGDYSDAVFAGSDDGTGHTLITLQSADDVPAFRDSEASPSVNVTERADTTGSSAADPFPAATGTIHFTDVDLTNRPTASITSQTVTWTDADHLTDLSALLTTDQIAALEHALTLHQAGNHNNGTLGWTYSVSDSALDFLAQGQTATVVSTVTLDDHRGGTDTAQVTVAITGTNDAPVIDVDRISVTQDSDEQVIVHGLSVSDADAGANETFTLAATTGHLGSDAGPSSQSGSLASINSALDAITYHEGSTEPLTDMVKLTVTDGHGASDSVNLIFNLAESANDPVALAGTTGRDVFFGTGYQEQFVFAADSGHDTIVNFTPGQDHIDLSAIVTTSDLSAWMAQHITASPTNSADTLITIDAADSIVLKGVSVGSLHTTDFVVHP